MAVYCASLLHNVGVPNEPEGLRYHRLNWWHAWFGRLADAPTSVRAGPVQAQSLRLPAVLFDQVPTRPVVKCVLRQGHRVAIQCQAGAPKSRSVDALQRRLAPAEDRVA